MESPLKVVLDSNILISALISKGVAHDFIYKLINKDVQIVISDYIVTEVNEVLTRKKFQDKQILYTLWNLIQKDVTIVKIKSTITKVILRDPKDHPILQTAIKSKAEFIITGDEDLLSLKSWGKIIITNMKDFEKLIQNERS